MSPGWSRKTLTRQFEVLQHHAKGFVNGHVAVVALVDECMHHRDLQCHSSLCTAVGHEIPGGKGGSRAKGRHTEKQMKGK